MNLKPIPDINYPRLITAVAREIDQGSARIIKAYTHEVLKVCWNVGRAITETTRPGNEPSARNAVIVAKLSKTFARSESYFYHVIRFYKLYPVFPRTNLSWSHYVVLMSIDNEGERRRLEQKAERENIGVNDLRGCLLAKRAHDVIDVSKKDKKIRYTRGKLYYYRIIPADKELGKDRMFVDVGFNIERDVRAPKLTHRRTGRIVSVVKTGEDYSIRLSKAQPDCLYTYWAYVQRVIDADTFFLRVDLGFRTRITRKVRLRAIDAPEIKTALGYKAKTFVQAIFDRNPWVVIKTYKEEKYGRILVDVFTGSKEQDGDTIAREGEYLNQLLIDKGFAIPMR